MDGSELMASATPTLIDVLRLPREIARPVYDYDIHAVAMTCKSAYRALTEGHFAGTLPPLSIRTLVHCRPRLDWALRTFLDLQRAFLYNDAGAYNLAGICAGEGALESLQHVGKSMSTGSWDAGICREAAIGGHVEILQWLRSLPGRPCPWDGSVCANAASAGHLHVLQWLRQNGCPWSDMTTAWAEVNRHHELKQWALDNGCDYSSELVIRLRMARMMQAMR